MITCGATTGPKVGIDIRHLFSKQQTILGSTMGNIEAFDKCLSLVSAGKIKPVIDRTFRFSEVKKAQDHLENGKQIGKIILLP